MSSKIKTAGGIVIRDDKILFIYKNGRWDLPKGKLEKGNSSRETAVIEISEELIIFFLAKRIVLVRVTLHALNASPQPHRPHRVDAVNNLIDTIFFGIDACFDIASG